MNNNPFTPVSHGAVTVNATAAASPPTLAAWGASQVRIYVSGANPIRIEFDGSAADANSMLVPAGAVEIFSIPPNCRYSVIAPGGDTTAELTFGSGM